MLLSIKLNRLYPVFIDGLRDRYGEANTRIYEMFVPNTLMSAHRMHCDMNPVPDSTTTFNPLNAELNSHLPFFGIIRSSPYSPR